jgi:phenylpropionate dioxygenase-like ring-hydroxylating dioxygenase large terminal subunit
MATSLSETQNESLTRGMKLLPQGIDGYHECWYPVCLATEVPTAGVRGFKFLNGKVIVFRDANGKPSVLSAFCRHLGVDLSLGKVVDNRVQCPYHHWEYDGTGQCVKTAVGDTPPRRAKLHEFPAREHLGLIWAYYGETPRYEIPSFPYAEDELEYMVTRGTELPMDAYMLYSNTMDLQHLISLHGAEFDETPADFDITDHTISYTQEMTLPKLGRSVQTITLHGTNCVSLASEVNGRMTFMMSSGLSTEGPLTKTFNVSATLKRGSKHATRKGIPIIENLLIKLHLRMINAFGNKLNADDDPIFRTMSPRLDNLSSSDRALSIFFRFVQNYPRTNLAADLICNDYMAAAQRSTRPNISSDSAYITGRSV